MIDIYLFGIVASALLYGFNTPDDGDYDGLRLTVTVLGWPIIIIAAFGQAFRMFNSRRSAEDAANENP